MYMAEETKKKLNDVITHSFLLNMICDNAVYEIDYAVYPKVAELFHAEFAHHWPQVADQFSGLMIRLNAHPVRGNLVAEYNDHNGDLAAIFADIADAVREYREDILDLIEIADLNNDAEVKLICEEILLQLIPYRKQADIWAKEAKRYANDYKSFDARFDEFTNAIPVSPSV